MATLCDAETCTSIDAAAGRGVIISRSRCLYAAFFAQVAIVAVAFYTIDHSYRGTAASPVEDSDSETRALYASVEGSTTQPPYYLPNCPDQARWDQQPWDFLSGTEQDAQLLMGWTVETWNLAHPPLTTTNQQQWIDQLGPGPAESPPGGRRLEMEMTTTFAEESDEGRQLQAMTLPPTTSTTTLFIPPSATTCFQNLSADRQDAVYTLGYNVTTWHACMEGPANCSWPPGMPTPNAPCKDQMAYQVKKFDKPWFALTVKQQIRLGELGWNANRWKRGDTPTYYTEYWDDLQPKQRRAAIFLGYTQAVWEGCVQETTCIERLEIMDQKMASWKWGKMPEAIQEHLEKLGWTEQTWNEGQHTDSRKLEWSSLDRELKSSAKLLGFSEDVWGLCPNAPCLQRHSYVMAKYGGPDHSGLPWNSMKLATQQAWMLLGYTQELWESRKEASSQQLTWNELSMEQRKQAEFLGFNLATWAGCYEDWGPAASRVNLTKKMALDPMRQVRGRMTIQIPFTDISGNVYGKEVADVPTAFITIFEEAVARALFCGNPPLATSTTTYMGQDGQPLCVVPFDYEKQRYRVKVQTVVEGSIIVDFILMKTTESPTSAELFAAMHELLANKQSPLCRDILFGRFAREASLVEVNMTVEERAEIEAAANFEQMRAKYDKLLACNLRRDFRNGDIDCPTDGTSRSLNGCLLTWFLAVVALAFAPSNGHSM